MSWLVRDSIEQLRALSDEYDPWIHDRDPDEPPELDDDWAMSMWDPVEGWLDA